jgi:nitrous oxidase accessory protein NosD
VEFRRVAGAALRHCTVEPDEGSTRTLRAVGVLVVDGEDVTVEENTLEALQGGVVVMGQSGRVRVAGNRIRGPTVTVRTKTSAGRTVDTTVADGRAGVLLSGGVVGPCAVERNLVSDYREPIVVGADAGGTSVCGNEVFHVAGSRPRTTDDPRRYAIDIAAAGALVRDNEVRFGETAPWHGGVRVTAPGARVETNVVRGPEQWRDTPPYGVLVMPGSSDERPVLPHSALVRGNTLLGALVGVSVSGSASLHDVDSQVPENGLMTAFGVVNPSGLRVADVQVLENHVAGPRSRPDRPGHRGIEVLGGTRCVVAGNRLGGLPTGIGLALGDANRVTGNALVDVQAGVTGLLEQQLRIDANVVGPRTGRNAYQSGIAGYGLERSVVHDNHLAGADYGITLGPSPPPELPSALVLPDGTTAELDARGGRDNRIAGNRVDGGLIGAAARGESGVALSGNVVNGARAWGLVVTDADEATLAHNRVVGCGFAADELPADAGPPIGIGIGVMLPMASRSSRGTTHATIHACEVRDTGQSDEGRTAATETHGILASAHDVRLTDNRLVRARVGDGGLPPEQTHRAITVQAARAEVVGNAVDTDGGGTVIAVASSVDSAQEQHAVEEAESVTFANNRCTHRATSGSGVVGPSVLLGARLLSLVGNQVLGEGGAASVEMRSTKHAGAAVLRQRGGERHVGHLEHAGHGAPAARVSTKTTT